jgi:hypothetical protein
LRDKQFNFFGGYMLKIIKRLGMVLLAGMFFIQPAMAARTVTIDMNPSNSNGAVNYSTNGSSNENVVYQYTITDGQSVTDTIPVQLCMLGSDPGWTSVDVSFGSPAGNLSVVTPPANQTFYQATATPDCTSGLKITIATGALTTGNYNANFNLQGVNPVPGTGANRPNVSFYDFKNIHIKVTVLPAEGSNVSCYMTDSEGMFLADCDGNPVTVSGSDNGRFRIVASKKSIEVSTNPGQFYYNLVWLNTTGATQTVDVEFARTGVNPHGTNALHAMVFNSYEAPLTPAEFATANADGIPEGADDAVSGVEVPDGSTLLVTYHLVWNGLGAPVPGGCATNCPTANQQISVTGTVNGEGIAEVCTAGARGYKK